MFCHSLSCLWDQCYVSCLTSYNIPDRRIRSFEITTKLYIVRIVCCQVFHMHQMDQHQFDYGDTTELPPPPNVLDGASLLTEGICSQPTNGQVQSEGIWGTQPPLDPSLMDIAKIAVLTRKKFGTDDLTILIPKASFLHP